MSRKTPNSASSDRPHHAGVEEEAPRDPAVAMEAADAAATAAAASPRRPRSARYADKGYPDYAEPPDVAVAAGSPSRPRSARLSGKGHADPAGPDVAVAAASPSRPRSARYADKGYPDYAEPPDVAVAAASPRSRPRSAEKGRADPVGPDVTAAASPRRPRSAEKGHADPAGPDVVVAAGSPCRTRTARLSEKGHADPVVSTASPCRPRSARYADKGYPNYAEPDGRRGHKRNVGGVPMKNPEAQGGTKRPRAAAEATRMEGAKEFLLIQGNGNCCVALDVMKRRTTAATAMDIAVEAGKVFPSAERIAEVEPMDDGGDESVGGGGGGKSARLLVKETLRAFSSYYHHSVQEESQRAEAAKKQREEARAAKCQADNHDDRGYQEPKRTSQRPDLKALTKMKETNAVLYPEKRIGHLPGIDVGDQFYSRAELVVLGLHGHWMNGIDCMGLNYRDKRGYEDLTFPLATCIVISGIYEDNLDKADEIIYTGQGGKADNHHQKSGQTMVRGNLALKNSKDNGNPVRVIRGHIEVGSYTGKVYTYDGLYKVVNYWQQKGVQGHLVFQFRLKRLEGQPPLTTSRVSFTRGDAPVPISELPGLVCGDISCGQENFPVPATNLVDNPPVPPSDFVYSKSLQIPKDIKIPANSTGCNCKGDCSSSENCLCAERNGSDLPYVSRKRKDGSRHKNVVRLVEAKAIVFECGANCSCDCSCVNRTSQHGLQYHLEVFKTESKGWGVRTWDTILPGALICEYTGVLRRTTEVEGVQENNYLFDIDCLQTIKGLDGREGVLWTNIVKGGSNIRTCLLCSILPSHLLSSLTLCVM